MLKRLYRSRKERMLGGVCMGIARYFNVDVVIVRLAWVLLALANGPGFIAYIIAWIIVPEEPLALESAPDKTAEKAGTPESETPAQREEPYTRDNSQKALGYILVALGVYFLLRALAPHFRWNLSWGYSISQWWPALVIAVGLAMVLGVFDRRREQ